MDGERRKGEADMMRERNKKRIEELTRRTMVMNEKELGEQDNIEKVLQKTIGLNRELN